MLRVAAASARVAVASAARYHRVAARSASYFTKEHEYAKVDGKVATCGITNFAQQQLGDVVFVGLPSVGDSFEKGCVDVIDPVAAHPKAWGVRCAYSHPASPTCGC